VGRRSEQRIALRVPILVRGTDSRGTPFLVTAQTHDITAAGASINGLKGIADVGSKVEIEYQDKKAKYRVQWIGQVGTPRSGQAGVKCLEPGNYIWGVPLSEWTPDTFDPDRFASQQFPHASSLTDAIGAASPGVEQRRFPRVSCRIEATLVDETSAMALQVKVTDLSLGGCYVEMLAPLPLGSSVEVALDIAQGVIRARGKVVVAQAGMGMGIAFTSVALEDFEKLREIAPPGPRPTEREQVNPPAPPRATPSSPPNGRSNHRASQIAPSTQEVLEAILRILLRKGIVSEEEMAKEFEKLITAKS
jgi:hypothetical protein